MASVHESAPSIPIVCTERRATVLQLTSPSINYYAGVAGGPTTFLLPPPGTAKLVEQPSRGEEPFANAEQSRRDVQLPKFTKGF